MSIALVELVVLGRRVSLFPILFPKRMVVWRTILLRFWERLIKIFLLSYTQLRDQDEAVVVDVDIKDLSVE